MKRGVGTNLLKTTPAMSDPEIRSIDPFGGEPAAPALVFPWAEALGVAEARVRNLLLRPRTPLEFAWPDESSAYLSCRTITSADAFDHETLSIVASAGSWSVVFFLDDNTWQALSVRLPSKTMSASTSLSVRALWLEFVFLSLVEKIERRLECRLELNVVKTAPDIVPNVVCHIEVHESRIALPCHIDAPDTSHMEAILAAVWPARPRSAGQLRLPIRWLYGTQDLSFEECRSLRTGDVVMLAQPIMPRFVVGDRLTAAAHARQPILASGLVPITTDGDLWMTDSKDTEPRLDNDQEQTATALGAVPVRLTCQIGQTMLSLAEVRALDQGSVLAFDKSPESVIDILLNGRRMGSGSLVRLGEGVGVRIDELSLDD